MNLVAAQRERSEKHRSASVRLKEPLVPRRGSVAAPESVVYGGRSSVRMNPKRVVREEDQDLRELGEALGLELGAKEESKS